MTNNKLYSFNKYHTDTKSLGDVPNDLSDDNILNLFLYTFEYNWISDFFSDIQDIPAYFKNELNDIESRFPNLSVSKKWWGLNLYSLLNYSKYYKMEYLLEVTQSIYRKLDLFDEKELCEISNLIINALYFDISDMFMVRPLMVDVLKATTVDSGNVRELFIENKAEFIKIFQKHLKKKDILKEYIDSALILPKKITKEYINFWDSYFELYMIFFIYSHISTGEDDINDLKSKRFEKIYNNSIGFLTASIEDFGKIDGLNNELCLLILELLNKNKES